VTATMILGFETGMQSALEPLVVSLQQVQHFVGLHRDRMSAVIKVSLKKLIKSATITISQVMMKVSFIILNLSLHTLCSQTKLILASYIMFPN
jgi:hypothetical protein